MVGSEARLTIISEESVRLVIWDLDDTLWAGSLSEGGIKNHIPHHYGVVRELARRGIMSSICSKNDFEAVRLLLLDQGMWDYFIFPSIDWSGKGERIKSIIDAVQLRPQSVLFIDDHPLNRAEAVARVPGLRAVDETFIEGMLENPLFAGKNDRELVRLAQYKNLETRAVVRQHEVSDDAFLRNCDIRVDIEHDCVAHIERIVELLNRTNQLNFTKKRLPEDFEQAKAELLSQLNATSGRRAGVVRVRDRFGNYGVVGFWMMDGIWVEPYIIHFVFSCRTLGMGIEQWVYEKLGRPRLNVVGEVVATLSYIPDWINKSSYLHDEVKDLVPWENVRLRGGCELEVLKHFIEFKAPSVVSEFVFPRDGQVIWRSHSITLFEQQAAATREGQEALQNLGFQQEDLSSDFLCDLADGTCLILSNSADGQVALFKHKRMDLIVPIKLFGIDVLNPDRLQIESYVSANNLSKTQRQLFERMLYELSTSFVPVLFQDFDFPALYRRIVNSIPPSCLLIILQPVTFAPHPSGATVDLPEQEIINLWTTQAAEHRTNIRVVHSASCINSEEDLRNFSHLHFKRDVYYKIYQAIEQTYSQWKQERALLDVLG